MVRRDPCPKDIQLAYCMTVHKFREVRALMFALSLNIPTMPAFLTVADLYGGHAQRTPPYLRSRHLPGRSSPGRKAKTDQSQLQENLEGLKEDVLCISTSSNYEVQALSQYDAPDVGRGNTIQMSLLLEHRRYRQGQQSRHPHKASTWR
jgi:hypothetical protein